MHQLSPFLAYLAGALSILSPCVLPLVPILFGTAQSRHRLGPVALGAGVAVSFTLAGLFIATIGFSLGLDEDLFRSVGGIFLAGFGLLLLLPALQARFAAAGAPVGAWANRRVGLVDPTGIVGQSALGLLLGLVWAPCVGPTLGAASMLAAQERDLARVALVMAAFGLGAATPLMLLGMVSASTARRMRGALHRTGNVGKKALGLSLLIVGLAVAFGFDRLLEAYLTEHSPLWLVRLSTRY